jgi:hypothetical protein
MNKPEAKTPEASKPATKKDASKHSARKLPAGARPAALASCTMTTRPMFRAEHAKVSGSKTAVYMARWVNTRGEQALWLDVTTATVAV